MKGAYINGDMLETIGNELDEGWFLTVDNDPYVAPYWPCKYDRDRDVYVNCDGFEMRNEYYEDYEDYEEN